MWKHFQGTESRPATEVVAGSSIEKVAANGARDGTTAESRRESASDGRVIEDTGLQILETEQEDTQVSI